MSYEFRSDSKTLDLPNPYAVENRVRFGLAAATGGLGVALLFVVRDRLSAGWNSSAILAMAAAIALVGHAVATTSKGLGQLRFYFGRDRPTGLAHERPAGSPDSEHLIDTVRRGALQFEEPVGPLNGLLYSLQRNLIFAPV